MNDTLRIEDRAITGIELGESHFREFKSGYQRAPAGSSLPRPAKDICRDVAEELVAFANADGGELLIGVEDDGVISGLPHNEDQLRMIEDSYKTHVHSETPLPTPLVRRLILQGKSLLYFRVAKSLSRVHLTSDGRCLQRFDRERRPVAPESIQTERREAASREYDRTFIPACGVKDLDVNVLDKIAQQVAPGYSPERLLQFLDLAEFGPEGLTLRRAAPLLFATDAIKWHPRSSVRIIRIAGTELKSGTGYNVVEDDTVTGNIVTILENSWDALRPHLARTRFQSSALFRENIIYPEDACREALINAVAHRDYSIEGKPIEIMIFDDRMEVRSPGRLLSSITVNELKALKGQHQSRNVYIARVLRELGYMREMGEGMRRIFASIRDFELVDPEIVDEEDSFIVTLFHKSIFSPKDVQWLSGYGEFDITKDEQRVILLGKDGRLLSTSQIVEALGIIDTEDFRALYERLNRKGLIFSAKQIKVRSHKRNVPRFKVRPPDEAQQYIEELRRALFAIKPFRRFDNATERAIRDALSLSSPFRLKPIWSLKALGYITQLGEPLPKLNALWAEAPEVGRAQQATSPSDAPLVATVTKLFSERGFGFARSSAGLDFFIHISELIERDQWNALVEGSRINLRPAEMSIPGKARTARSISIIE